MRDAPGESEDDASTALSGRRDWPHTREPDEAHDRNSVPMPRLAHRQWRARRGGRELARFAML